MTSKMNLIFGIFKDFQELFCLSSFNVIVSAPTGACTDLLCIHSSALATAQNSSTLLFRSTVEIAVGTILPISNMPDFNDDDVQT